MNLIALHLASAMCCGQTPEAARVELRDAFSRPVESRGLLLTDWDGQMANPAIALEIRPTSKLYLPARITLTTSSHDIMLSLFCSSTETGWSKTVYLEKGRTNVQVLVAVSPTRDAEARSGSLLFEVTDANQRTTKLTMPIEIRDLDRAWPLQFQVEIDNSHDQTGFFKQKEVRDIARMAADDWAYFLADQGFDEVPTGRAKSWMWNPDGFKSGTEVANSAPFRGFLLFMHGIQHEEGRSGAIASERGIGQTRNGKQIGLSCTGTVSSEISGNWNHQGWLLSSSDSDWWRSGNMSWEKHDYYSIVRHEMSHSFVFHRVHPNFKANLKDGEFVDAAVRAYLGQNPKPNDVDHFEGVIDPISRVGVFGNEYGGDMPRRRWWITKFDLLVAQAIGYKLRDVAATRELTLEGPKCLELESGRRAEAAFLVNGGVERYDFTIASGTLPPGMRLDRWTGKLSGTPTRAADGRCVLSVRDSSLPGTIAECEVTWVIR